MTGNITSEHPDANGRSASDDMIDRDRDSMFLLAEILVLTSGKVVQARVRNLSHGGMMVECKLEAQQGDALMVKLRNIGDVPARIAWVRPGQFGIAFDRKIDPKMARLPVGTGDGLPRYNRPILPVKRLGKMRG